MVKYLKNTEGLMVTFGDMDTFLRSGSLSNGNVVADLYQLAVGWDDNKPDTYRPMDGDANPYYPRVRLLFKSEASVELLIRHLEELQARLKARTSLEEK